MKLAIIAFVTFLMASRSEAAPDSLQFGARVAPASVLSQMKDDGRSVRFQQIDVGLGAGEIFCHIYAVNKNYFFDLFRPDGVEKFHRLNSVDLGKTPHSKQLDVSFMWLQPNHYRGPILRLYDQDFPGEWDSRHDLLVFPDGFEGRVVRENFLEKFIGGTAINPSFDSYDERGLLVINQWEVYETQVTSRVCLFWNGGGFVERKPRYAIISPLFKTYSEVKDFLSKPTIQSSDQIMKKPLVHPSRYYKAKGLKSGYLVVILGYLQLQSDAKKVADEMHQKNIQCSVLRLY